MKQCLNMTSVYSFMEHKFNRLKNPMQNDYVQAYHKSINGKAYIFAIINCAKGEVINKNSLLHIRQKVADSCINVNADDVILIILGGNAIGRIHIKNSLFINMNSCKMKKRSITEACLPIINELVEKVLKIKNINIAYKIHYKLIGEYETTPLIYVFVGLLVACYTASFVLQKNFSLQPQEVLVNGESYRLITYAFTHGNIAHLLGNIITLIYFGRIYISRNGFYDFLTVYLCGGIFAGLCSLLSKVYWSGEVNTSTVGASGAILAILGALCIDVTKDAFAGNKGRIWIYSLAILFSTVFVGSVDNFCHIGGFLAGMLLYTINSSIDAMAETYIINQLTENKKRIKSLAKRRRP